MLNNNFLVGTFISEVYSPYKYTPWMYLFESKVSTYIKIITQALLSHKIYYLSLIINARSITRALLPYWRLLLII